MSINNLFNNKSQTKNNQNDIQDEPNKWSRPIDSVNEKNKFEKKIKKNNIFSKTVKKELVKNNRKSFSFFRNLFKKKDQSLKNNKIIKPKKLIEQQFKATIKTKKNKNKNNKNNLVNNLENKKKISRKWFSFSKKEKPKEKKLEKLEENNTFNSHKNKEKKWNNSNVLETNLIKNQIIVTFNFKKSIFNLLFFIIFSSSIIWGGYTLLVRWGDSKVNYDQILLLKKINTKITIAESEVVKILNFENKIALVNSILNKHIYWTNFFKFLEDNTLSNVYYKNDLSFDTSGKYTFNVSAEKFDTIEAQVKHFLANEYVVDASVSSGQVEGGKREELANSSVSYNLELELKEKIFYDYK